MGTRHYDKEFKENAVNLSYERSNPRILAKELEKEYRTSKLELDIFKKAITYRRYICPSIRLTADYCQ